MYGTKISFFQSQFETPNSLKIETVISESCHVASDEPRWLECLLPC